MPKPVRSPSIRRAMRKASWGNVDLDEGAIHVGHNVTYRDVVKTPKTDSGVRTIAIDPTTVEHLSMWKDRQTEELAKI